MPVSTGRSHSATPRAGNTGTSFIQLRIERTFYVDEMVDHRVREAALQAAHDPGRVFQSSAEPITDLRGARYSLPLTAAAWIAHPLPTRVAGSEPDEIICSTR